MTAVVIFNKRQAFCALFYKLLCKFFVKKFEHLKNVIYLNYEDITFLNCK